MIRDDEVYQIGTITRTHGIRGELAFQFTDDVWDRTEADYLVLCLDGILVPFFLEEWRFRSDTTALVKFEDVDDANTATRFVGAAVFFPKALTPSEVAEEDITWRMLTGFSVLSDTGTPLGTVTSVDDTTANVLLYITPPDGNDILLPAVDEYITGIDYKARTIHAVIPSELLNLNT